MDHLVDQVWNRRIPSRCRYLNETTRWKVDRTGSGSCPVAETGCEDGRWIELSQDRVQ